MENADAAGISTLSLGEEVPPGEKSPQYVIAVDGMPLEAWLNKAAGDTEFDGLYPSLGMSDPADQRTASRLVAGRSGWTPLLVCGDDMDLSCLVVSAHVREEGTRVWWDRFGWGMDGEREIAAPALCFNKADYDRFVEEYVRRAANYIASVENRLGGPNAGRGMELDAASSRRTGAGDFILNLAAWAALVVLVILVVRFLSA